MRERIRLTLRSGFHFGMETERFVSQPALDNFLQSNKRAATDKENVGRIDREELLMRMLAAALWRNVGNRAFQNFQQRLLHAFAGHVAGDRRVLVFPTDLVDLIDVDYALLCALNVAVGRLQKFENDVLDVFSDIAGLSQRGCVDDCKRHAQHTRERLSQQGLAGARWSNQNDVGFLNFDIRTPARQLNPLVMLIDSDGQALLGFVLADYVFIQE